MSVSPPLDASNVGRPLGYGAKYAPPVETKGTHHGVVNANWFYRIGAALIDYSVPSVILQGFIYLQLDLAGWIFLFAFTVINSVVVQGMTGQSLGKRVLGIKVYRSLVELHTGRMVLGQLGIGYAALRLLLNVVIFNIPFVNIIGIFRPAWNYHYMSWSDSIAGTKVGKIKTMWKQPEIVGPVVRSD